MYIAFDSRSPSFKHIHLFFCTTQNLESGYFAQIYCYYIKWKDTKWSEWNETDKFNRMMSCGLCFVETVELCMVMYAYFVLLHTVRYHLINFIAVFVLNVALFLKFWDKYFS